MLVSKIMPNTTTETPDWLREMETILEEFNEGVIVVDDQLRVIFANEALTRMGRFERNEIQGCTPDEIFPSEDLPVLQSATLTLADMQKTILDGVAAWRHACPSLSSKFANCELEPVSSPRQFL
jgi:PAS domain-containing protein